MLARVLEPEVMDSEADAREYDSMCHSAVNAVFVDDLLAAIESWCPPHPTGTIPVRGHLRVLDIGTGTAQIPIELMRRTSTYQVVALDAAEKMIDLASANIATANLDDRIELFLADAKDLPFDSYSFPVVISNSIVHHIAEPAAVLAEAVRVGAAGALQFHRDLCRPADESELARLVATYAGHGTSYQQRLFAESLRAALTLEEMRSLVEKVGFAPETVRMTSDRHWTWVGNHAV